MNKASGAQTPQRVLQDIFQGTITVLENFAHQLLSFWSFIPQIDERRNRVLHHLRTNHRFCALRASWRERGKFVLELDNHPLGEFPAHARYSNQTDLIAFL